MVNQVEYNGITHEFPDEATPEMISNALGLKQKPKSPVEQKFGPLFSLKPEASEGSRAAFEQMKNPENWKQAGVGAAQGVLNIPSNVVNFPIDIGNFLNKTNAPRFPEFHFAPETTASKVGQIGGGLLPIGPAALKGGGLLAQLVAKTAGMGAGKVGQAIGEIPSSIVSKVFKGSLSPEELKRNLEAAKGTETNLGDIIGSPSLKRLQENVIGKIPFTGAEGALNRTGAEILNRGENLVQRHLGENDPLAVSDELMDILDEAKNTHRLRKDALYREADDIAHESGLTLNLPQFSKEAKKHISDIERSGMLQFEPETRALLSRLNIYKSPVESKEITGALQDVSGNPLFSETITSHPSLKEANILSGKLNELANKYGSSVNISDRNAARVMGSLSRTLKSDIKNEIEKSGNESLKTAFNKAEKNYKENYSSFLDRDIHKFTSGKKPAEELISTFLKTGGDKDRSEQLSRLLKVIPEDKHNLIRYAYLSRAMEGPSDMKVVNPHKLRTLWNKLGENQKKILFPNDSERREMDNFSLLVGKNPKAVNRMWNPETGQKNLDLITALTLMHLPKSLKEIVGGALGTKFLTSENQREKVVGKILKSREGE
jgi:hypothetical protein